MRIFCTTLALLISLLATSPVQGIVNHIAQYYQTDFTVEENHPSTSDESFKKAVEVYYAAEFDKAIKLFSEIATDNGQDRIIRRDALHYLGRSYLAVRKGEEARTALEQLTELEPPRIDIDPDIESPQLLRLYYDVHKEKDGGYAYQDVENKQTLAIVDFANQSIDDHEKLAPLSKGFSSLMINQLNGATDLKVVERERISWLLDELELQEDVSRVDRQTAVRAGRLLGAHMVLFGSYMKFGKTMNLSVRLVSVETGEILMTDQVQGKADKFFELAESLSLSITKSINVSLSEYNLGVRNRETRSLDALLSYSEGLDLLEDRNYKAAFEKFLEAYDHDSTYKRAILKAKSIEPFI